MELNLPWPAHFPKGAFAPSDGQDPHESGPWRRLKEGWVLCRLAHLSIPLATGRRTARETGR